MVIFGHKLADIPIIAFSSGTEVAQTTKPIIDWTDLKIVGFRVEANGQNLVLLVQDLREYNGQLILINSQDDLVEPVELIRLQTILAKDFQLVGAQVKSESGTNLGQVSDYTFEPKSFRVQQLHVKRSLLKSFLNDSLIINRTQIIDITPPTIVVRDSQIKEPFAVVQPAASE